MIPLDGLAILNGLVGDHLARTDNGLATRMMFVGPHPHPSKRAVVLVHGLMNSETCFRLDDGSDYGSLLERDLGFTPYYVRYNSGLSVQKNGAALARLLDGLRDVEEIVLLGYSMGGLIAREACAVGGPWLERVSRAIYIATPHQGSPFERIGRGLTRLLRAVDDPYTRLIADIGDLRSDGIKDLGDGLEQRLPSNIEHHLIAGSLAGELGDAMVPLASARNGDAGESSRVRTLRLSHTELPRHLDVYAIIRAWCAAQETA